VGLFFGLTCDHFFCVVKVEMKNKRSKIPVYSSIAQDNSRHRTNSSMLFVWLSSGLIIFSLVGAWYLSSHPKNSISPRPLVENITLTAPLIDLHILGQIPHENTAFTEGLSWVDGELVESTGPYSGSLPAQLGSRIQVLDPNTGRVLRKVSLPAGYFGEGVASASNSLLASLTWISGRGFLWTWPDLKPVGTFSFSGEGWGLASNAGILWMSDGSSVVRRWSAATRKPIDTIEVTDSGHSVPNINELEWAHGWLLANVWRTPNILVIDPNTGHVRARFDLTSLSPNPSSLRDVREDVPNGIAFDPKANILYLTGKQWPWIIRAAWPKTLEDHP
jgi:glutamine cyclotransferase